MRVTLEIDEDLVGKVIELTGEKSKGKAVNKALEDYVRRRKIEELRSMLGKIDMVDNLKELEDLEIEEMEGAEW